MTTIGGRGSRLTRTRLSGRMCCTDESEQCHWRCFTSRDERWCDNTSEVATWIPDAGEHI